MAGYKMKGFSYPGKSPLKQKPGGKVGEALAHWEKHKTHLAKVKKYGMDAVNKEITRIAKGGAPKAELLKKAKDVVSKKPGSFAKRLYRGLGGKLLGTAGTYVGSMGTAKATQPGTGTHGGKKIGKYNPKTGKYE